MNKLRSVNLVELKWKAHFIKIEQDIKPKINFFTQKNRDTLLSVINSLL